MNVTDSPEFDTAKKWVGLERDKMRFELVKAALQGTDLITTHSITAEIIADALVKLADAVLHKLGETK